MITVKSLPTAGHYEVHVSGKVTDDDYEHVLIPALDRAIEEHQRIRAIVILADDTTFSLAAVLDDAEFGMRHWNGFDRLALVAKPGWIPRMARGMAILFPCPVGVFTPAETDDARRWLSQSLGAVHQTDLGDGVLHVQLLGKLDPAVMAAEEQDMNAFVRKNERFRLLLDLREFDGWQGLAALRAHFAIARNHYDLIDRAAIVGDKSWQKLGQSVLGAVSGAKTKYFDADDFNGAKAWIKA
ncbi:STAS/SEC14 domain-containing protein [Primorskyibacter sp. 2E107]|uniref:STAS/SEC14 domain-containing protein n=1 Tax=Primorskyibacter sp. 2E107 TaxID=3403458 RepID=UPI003AF4E868